jgi:23S rRNA pseudouridine1911/1915/1917 synthase
MGQGKEHPVQNLVADPGEPRNVRASPDARGERLDLFLTRAFPELTRARVQALVAQGQVQVDDRQALKSSARLKGGERIVLTVPAPRPSALAAEDLPLEILF